MRPHRLIYMIENIHNLHKKDRIVGFFLYDKHKELVARIDGIMTEEGTPRARYIVISQGGFLNILGKKTLVPREICEVVDLGEVTTDRSKQSLHDAPSPDNLDNVTREEEELILSYFDLQPYWAGE